MNRLQQERLSNGLSLIIMLAALSLAHMAALAQTDTGRITGTVKDVNGALVPGANVLVKNERTVGLGTNRQIQFAIRLNF